MISEDDAVERLVAACPGFLDSFSAYLNEGGDPKEHFNVMGELARWIVQRMSTKRFGCFRELFDELEVLIKDGGPGARDILIIGFIEDIHNNCVRLADPDERVDPDLVLPFLGPKSREAWFGLVHGYIRWGEKWPGRVEEG